MTGLSSVFSSGRSRIMRGVVRRRAAGRVGINKASLKASANATAKHTRAIFAELDGSEDLYLDAIKIGGLSAKLPHFDERKWVLRDA